MRLSAGERYDEWRLIRRGEARVVIGARSAIFAPLESLGVIVIDEEHEHTFKQESCPRYHGRDLAVMSWEYNIAPVPMLGRAIRRRRSGGGIS